MVVHRWWTERPARDSLLPPCRITEQEGDASDTNDVSEDELNCTSDSECDDHDPCTADTCDPELNDCVHEHRDEDGDGSRAIGPDGTCGRDCNDEDPAIHPGAAPDCIGDGDFDCDGLPDRDKDMDGHESPSCGGDDCDDYDALTFPGAAETCGDGIDEDCDGSADTPVAGGEAVKLLDEGHDTPTHAVAWTGSELVMAWCDSSMDVEEDTYMARISPGGGMVGSTVRLTDDIYMSETPSIVWTGEEIGLAMEDASSSGVHLQRLSPTLSLLDPQVEMAGFALQTSIL